MQVAQCINALGAALRRATSTRKTVHVFVLTDRRSAVPMWLNSTIANGSRARQGSFFHRETCHGNRGD
jgi:hypothetical protein